MTDRRQKATKVKCKLILDPSPLPCEKVDPHELPILAFTTWGQGGQLDSAMSFMRLVYRQAYEIG